MKEIKNIKELRGREGLVLFYATWCPFCQRFMPIFLKKAGGSSFSMRLDDEDSPDWDRFKIETIPTVVLFKNGAEIKRLEAKRGIGINEEDFKVFLDKHAGH